MRLRARVPEIRALLRGPVFAMYLTRVRASVIAMTAHIAFMTLLLEPLLRWLMPPPKRAGGLLSIFDGPAKTPPHLEVLVWLDPVLWVLSWAGFCILLERSIKPALARAREKSRALEAEAQARLAKGEVVAGLTLLAEAVALSPDEPDRGRLQATLLQVEATLGPVAAGSGVLAAPAPVAGSAARWAPGPTANRAAGSGATALGPTGTMAVAGWPAPAALPEQAPAYSTTATSPLAPNATSLAAPPPVSNGAFKTMAGGRITLEKELGAGAMGRVFAATDQLLGRRLAIKELIDGVADNPEHRERFLREARVLARLSHPNIVQVFDLLTEGDRSYLCMELVEGVSLEDELERRGTLPVREAAAVGQQIASGLAYAHTKGVVHRDLKPANVLIAGDGAVKVVDFGVARLIDTRVTRTGMLIGTPVYMSPEQIRGEDADERSDLYSLGALLYELVAGKPPFDGNIASLLTRHLTVEPERLAVDPRDRNEQRFADLVGSLLAKEPADRPANATLAAERLGAVRANVAV